MSVRLAVLGAGSWGTAFAKILADLSVHPKATYFESLLKLTPNSESLPTL